MKNSIWLALNNLRVTFRKRGMILTLFVLPVVGILFSIMVYTNAGTGSIKLGVVDGDNSVISRDLLKSLGGRNPQFKVISVEAQQVEEQITTGKVDCVLLIPAGFAGSIYRENPLQVEIVSIRGEMVTAWFKNYINTYMANLRDLAMAAAGRPEVFDQIYANFIQQKVAVRVQQIEDGTKNKGMTTQSIGFLLMFMLYAASNAAEMILEEKRKGTYFRICSAPVQAKSYIAGNVLTNLAIVTVQIVITLVFIFQVFKITTYIPFAQLLIILLCFGLAAIGLGLLLVAFSKDSVQVNTMQDLVVLPTCMLSGCFWQVDVMPKVVQKISDFLPQRWAMTAILKIQQGGDFHQILVNLAIILGFALTFFVVAVYRFGRNDSVSTFI